MFASHSKLLDMEKDEPQNELQALKLFANDAEKSHLISVALSHHQERVACFDEDLETWYDYGCFLRRNEMPGKGEECFREILSRNPNHFQTLLAYGAVCCANEKYEKTLVLLQTAMSLKPLHPTVLVLMVFGYDLNVSKNETMNDSI